MTHIDKDGYLCIEELKWLIEHTGFSAFMNEYETKKYKINKEGLFEEVNKDDDDDDIIEPFCRRCDS